jgi:germination protein M
MNFSGNQRKAYVLSVVLLALTVVLCGAWGMWRSSTTTGAGEPAATTAPAPEPTAQVDLTATQTPAPTGTVRTTVYYQDNYGYLVPVTRTLPEEPGIARATLNLMVKSAYNDMEAARLGLRTVLPENTELDLDIRSDGTAHIDLGSEVMNMADAAAESKMVAAVVQTLTEFPTVKQVSFTVGGQDLEKLTHGTEIGVPFERGMLNLESAPEGIPVDQAKTVQLYFPGENSALLVPVTRMVYGRSDLETAVLELAKGPSAQSPLDGALPPGCGLIGVTVENGVATINFTEDFIRIAEDTDGGRAALRALVLTARQFEGVNEVRLQVEGEAYDPGHQTLAIPTFINDASTIAEEYIRTQSEAILETEE